MSLPESVFNGSIITFVDRVGVKTKNTSGLSSGTILNNVKTIVANTTTDADNTNVSIRDNKIGGSMIFAKSDPYIIYDDCRQFYLFSASKK